MRLNKPLSRLENTEGRDYVLCRMCAKLARVPFEKAAEAHQTPQAQRCQRIAVDVKFGAKWLALWRGRYSLCIMIEEYAAL